MNIVLNIVKQDEGHEMRRQFGDPSAPRIFVLNGHSRHYHASVGDAPFSIKSMPRGGARYRVDGRDHHVGANAALIVNGNQHYEMDYRSGGASESFCLFFDPALVREAWQSANGVPESPNVLFRPSSTLARRLVELRRAMASDALSADSLHEHLLEILVALTQAADVHRGQMKKVGARGRGVQANLLGKLDHARSLIEDEPAGVSLEVIARECGLSKFHLLRLFRAVYGEPPAAYAKTVRMTRAAALLSETRKPVTDIALDLGYSTPAAFTKAFRSHSGLSPAAYRAQN